MLQLPVSLRFFNPRDGTYYIIWVKRGMMLRAIIDRLTTKTSVMVIGVIGAGAVFYGILKDNSLIFIIGLILVLGGYLLVRRRIKESIRDKAS